ncbi:transmembrane protein 43 homolog [Atheta coriaria]|uniref:transmembrane protein 43 homolog n=1 Tax=Dalotia coriaria TaxID=877792 RepID=UPI0031F43307
MTISVKEEFKRTWVISTLGAILTVGGIWLLIWNEGRAVHHGNSLDEAFNNVVPLNIYEPVQAELDGRLVHISGNLLIDEPLTEPEYTIAIQAVKLKRRVQMFQWVEERVLSNYADTDAQYSESARNRDDSDYYYVTEWRDKLVDSSSFYIRHGHQNPKEMMLKSHIYISPSVRVGELTIGSEIKDKFNDYQEMTSDERPDRRDIKLHLGIYYHSHDVWKPEVGDIRVQFYSAGHNGDPVTIVAMQKDGNLVPFTTSKNHQIALLRHGLFNIKQMFDYEHSDVRFETWKMRIAGVFVLYAASVFLAPVIRAFTVKLPRHLALAEIPPSTSFTIAFSVALFVLSTAWIAHRPWIGVGLCTASFSPLIYTLMSIYGR